MNKYEEMLDIDAKKTLGIDSFRKEWNYEEIVNQYIIALDYYGNKAPVEFLSDLENLTSLNLSLNYCTLEVLVDYQKESYSFDDIDLKLLNNKHYRTLVEVGNSIRNRFINEDLEDIAENLYFNILMIAEILYNFETDDKIYKTKIYS